MRSPRRPSGERTTVETGTVTRRTRRRRWAVAAVVVLGVAGAALAWPTIRGPYASTPSCSWPAHIDHADPAQDGLIRCYLRAIAHHSTSGLRSVVRVPGDGGPIGFAAADFAHAADAGSGTATVTVTPNDVDSADAIVTIRYADGAHADLDIQIADPASGQSWRFSGIGVFAPDPHAPPTANIR